MSNDQLVAVATFRSWRSSRGSGHIAFTRRKITTIFGFCKLFLQFTGFFMPFGQKISFENLIISNLAASNIFQKILNSHTKMKKGLFLVLMFIGFCFSVQAQTVATTVNARPIVARAIFTIANFDQDRFDIIKPTLEKIEGVTFTNTSPAHKQIVFVYNPALTSAAKIGAVVLSLGQDATLTQTTEPKTVTKE